VTRRSVSILIGATFLVLIAFLFVFPDRLLSPGPLVAGHAQLATDCFACHTPWQGANAGRCITCHVVRNIGLRTTKGQPLVPSGVRIAFHQELLEQDCMACHSDHQAPRLAPGNRKQFSHGLLRTGVRDRCADCHSAPLNALHRDLTMSCGQCHDSRRWKPASFDHDRFFVLDSDHNAPCTTCHSGGDYSHYTCFGCHEHEPGGVRARHVEEGISQIDNCVRCHRSASEGPEGD